MGNPAVNILIVDDERETREGLSALMDWKAEGLSLMGAAASAAEALGRIEEELPGVVILDVKMPEMNGIELLRILMRKYPSIKVIMVSGYDEFSFARDAVELHAFAYLLKPIDTAKLKAKILEARDQVVAILERVRLDEQLRSRYESSIPLLRKSFLNQLLVGSALDPEESLEAQAEGLGLPSGDAGYQVAVMELRVPGKEGMDTQYLRYSLQEKAEEWLGAACETLMVSSLVTVVASGGPVSKPLLERIRSWANDSLGLFIAIGVGQTVKTLSGIHESYEDARNALSYRLVFGWNEILDYRELGGRPAVGQAQRRFEHMTRDRVRTVHDAILGGSESILDAQIRDLTAALREAMLENIGNAQSCAFALSYMLREIASGLDIDPGQVQEGSLYRFQDTPRTVEETDAFLRSFTREVREALAERSEKQNSYLVRKAIKYMKEHCKEDISLTSIAEVLQIHPNYLSKVFKTQTGKTFIEHEIELKMEEAKNLLSTTFHKVYEVADMLGYRDVNHFTKLFKKTVGVSPSEYRELQES